MSSTTDPIVHDCYRHQGTDGTCLICGRAVGATMPEHQQPQSVPAQEPSPNMALADVSWIVVREREIYPPEVYRFGDEAGARAFHDTAQQQWTECVLARIVKVGAQPDRPYLHEHKTHAYDGSVKCWTCDVVLHGVAASQLWARTPAHLRAVLDGGEPPALCAHGLVTCQRCGCVDGVATPLAPAQDEAVIGRLICAVWLEATRAAEGSGDEANAAYERAAAAIRKALDGQRT